MIIANRKHSAAAVQSNARPEPAASLYAKARPIITGTAAPESVLGLAASIQALAEFCLTVSFSMIFFKIYLQK